MRYPQFQHSCHRTNRTLPLPDSRPLSEIAGRPQQQQQQRRWRDDGRQRRRRKEVGETASFRVTRRPPPRWGREGGAVAGHPPLPRRVGGRGTPDNNGGLPEEHARVPRRTPRGLEREAYIRNAGAAQLEGGAGQGKPRGGARSEGAPPTREHPGGGACCFWVRRSRRPRPVHHGAPALGRTVQREGKARSVQGGRPRPHAHIPSWLQSSPPPPAAQPPPPAHASPRAATATATAATPAR